MQIFYQLAPQGGKPFDVRQIERQLTRLPGAFRLETAEELTYVVTTSPAMARHLQAELAENPETPLFSQGLVTLAPNAITVYQDAPRPVLDQLRTWVTWLLETYDCKVSSETGMDWTARYAKRPGALFEVEPFPM